jgi:hypothetical protein
VEEDPEETMDDEEEGEHEASETELLRLADLSGRSSRNLYPRQRSRPMVVFLTQGLHRVTQMLSILRRFCALYIYVWCSLPALVRSLLGASASKCVKHTTYVPGVTECYSCPRAVAPVLAEAPLSKPPHVVTYS